MASARPVMVQRARTISWRARWKGARSTARNGGAERAARRGRFACTTLEAYVMWPLAEEGASPSGSLRIARRALGVSLGSAPPLASLTRNALGQKNLEQALVGNISLVCEGLELLQECLR